MKDIEKAIGETSLASLMENKLSYSDALPESADIIESVNQKKIIMKYYDGTITKEEHIKNKKSLNSEEFIPLTIYEKYIFSDINIFSMDLSDMPQEMSEEVIDLWIILKQDSNNLEQFQKLMFILYCQKEDIRLKTIAMTLYKEKEWAREYVHVKKYEEKFLILMNQNEKYNLIYGIKSETMSNMSDNNKYEEKEKETVKETDWISKVFGG